MNFGIGALSIIIIPFQSASARIHLMEKGKNIAVRDVTTENLEFVDFSFVTTRELMALNPSILLDLDAHQLAVLRKAQDNFLQIQLNYKSIKNLDSNTLVESPDVEDSHLNKPEQHEQLQVESPALARVLDDNVLMSEDIQGRVESINQLDKGPKKIIIFETPDDDFDY